MMKKTCLSATILVSVLILSMTPVFASADGDSTKAASSGCPATKATDAKKDCPAMTSSAGCPFSKKAEAKTAATDSLCPHNAKCTHLTLAIKGMTCTGCETTITKALKADSGVMKVVSIDHKTGRAVICYDSTKVQPATLTSLVTKSGYEAEIIPAVAASDGPHKGATCNVFTGKCEKPKTEAKTESENPSH
jgi:copper chaperone CopZ